MKRIVYGTIAVAAIGSALISTTVLAASNTYHTTTQAECHAALGTHFFQLVGTNNGIIETSKDPHGNYISGFLVWQADQGFTGDVAITGDDAKFTAGDYAEPDPSGPITNSLHLDAAQRHLWTTLIQVRESGCYTLKIRGDGVHEDITVRVAAPKGA